MDWDRHHSKRLVAELVAVVSLSIAAGAVAAGSGSGLLLVLLGTAVAALCVDLVKGTNRPFRIIDDFLVSLLNRDYSATFSPSHDRKLRDMFDKLNRISNVYRNNLYELETHQLYYQRILRIITHEIRNTVTPISSLTDELLRHPTDDATLRDSLEVIHHQTDEIIHFLNQYHQLTHLPTPIIDNVSADNLVEKMRTLLSKEPGIDLLHTQVSGHPVLRGDESLLTLALLNVVRNALQAVEGGKGTFVMLTVAPLDGNSCITVTDNGPGIPPERKEDIFMPFYSTKSKGSGIGLCLARQVMRLHHGDLQVMTVPHKTTTFLFTFEQTH